MNTLEARDMPWGNLIHDLRRYATLVLDAAGLHGLIFGLGATGSASV